MRGPEITFALLGETENDAAVPVLLRGLESSDRALRDGSLRALLHRRSERAEEEILRRWPRDPRRSVSLASTIGCGDGCSEYHRSATARNTSL